MKRTPLYREHIDAGAKMVEFAGYEMPVQYSSILQEHMAVRTSAGIFDVSHMGEIQVKGPEARRFISSLIPTSMERLESGRGMYTLLCLENGGVIDDLFVFKVSEEHYFLVVNASTTEKDFAWLKAHQTEGVYLEDISQETAKIDIQGPASPDVMKRIFDPEMIGRLERFSFTCSSFSDTAIIISATGYTGERGYELFINNSKAAELWQRLLSEGASSGIIPAGLGARDTLRLESCYSLYGHEINETINPVEAGLGWLISSAEEYIGKSELIRFRAEGTPREQVAVKLTDKGIPREAMKIMFKEREIGYVTSGAFSPLLKNGIALALVERGAVTQGSTVEIMIRGRGVKGVIIKKPFYKYNG